MRLGRPALICLGLGILVAGLQAGELWSLWSTPQPLRLHRGDLAPALRFRSTEGREQDLAGLRGSPVLVAFWASWCVPCRAELPELAKAVKEMNAEAGPTVHVLAINTADEPQDAAAVIRDPSYAGFVFGLDPDGKLAKAWGANALPTLVLVRPDGKIEEARVGYDRYTSYRLHSFVRAARPKSPA